MTELHAHLQPVRDRLHQMWSMRCTAVGWLVSSVLALLVAVLRYRMVEGFAFLPTLAIVCLWLLGPMIGAIFAQFVRSGWHKAALAVDKHYELKDRSATALAFVAKQTADPLHKLQIQDAVSHLHAVNPKAVVPWHMPHSLSAALTVSAIMLVFTVLGSGNVDASLIINVTVSQQAQKAAQELEELKDFNKEEKDEKVDKLVQEMELKIAEMQQPGVEPKEALAKLSEMQAALEEMQGKLAPMSLEAELKSVGEAMSLAEPFEAVAQALNQAEMEKAAQELEKLEVPDVDRQTEKSLKEKLEAVAKAANARGGQKLSEAIQQVSNGVCSKDGSGFKSGTKGLASECRKQSRRKKLSNLLRKQCNCLCECKSECESECKSDSVAKSKRPSNNWGRGAAGKEMGEKTAKLKTKPQMNLQGQQSQEGETDIETETTPEAQQAAQREYRKNLGKYKEINEAVLDAEPIPLGHRQTIRKYFELIRPQDGETDAVKTATEPESP